MSYVTNITGTVKPNFLESEVGLVLKTREIPQTLGEDDNGRKIVPAGTIFPTDDTSATGILFGDVDVTAGNAAGSVLVAGRVLEDAITIDTEAKKSLAASGIVFVTAPTITRE